MEMRRPKIGVGVIVARDGKVLMQKRRNAHGDGTWSFPGGHLEYGESPEECAARETQEEFGVEISGPTPVAFTNDVFAAEDRHYVTLFVQAKLESGEPKIMEPDKTSEIGWFAWDGMPQPLFLPIVNLLKQGFKPQ
jgi:8-oxo-dGTP diphosphatase